jgi:hypothetical protein
MFTALIAALALALVAPATIRAESSADNLRAALLAERDLGQGYQLMETQDNAVPGVPSAMAVFAQRPTLFNPRMSVVVDMLVEVGDMPFDRDAFAMGIMEGFQGASGFTAERIAAPNIGQDTVRFRAKGSVAGMEMDIDALLWRHGNLVAAVFMLSNQSADAADIARIQQQKIEEQFGPVS